MPIDIDSSFRLELAKLEQDALLDLYEIDLTAFTSRSGNRGLMYRLHNGLNEKGENVVWKGQSYTAYPVKGSNFAQSVSGTSNRPTLAISNLFGFVTGLVNDFDDCLGAVVTRRQVYANNLDPVNFISGTNPSHNRDREIVNHYLIEQVDAITSDVVQFKLAIPTELDKLKLPSRMMMANTCQCRYRSPECGYTGTAMFTDKDEETTDPKKDSCSKLFSGCRVRNNQRNFGAFIMINKL